METKEEGPTADKIPKPRKSAEDKKTDQEIGERIRQIRVDIADMDQRSFAARLGVTSPAVAQWESGAGITRANLDRIVAAFDISRDWLHEGVGTPQLSRIVSKMHILPPDRIQSVLEYIQWQIDDYQKTK